MKPRLIDTEDIYHLEGGDGIRSYLRNPVVAGGASDIASTPITVAYEYEGPFKLFTESNEDGSVITVKMRNCVIQWEYHIIMPSAGMVVDVGVTTDLKGKNVYAVVDCSSTSPVVEIVTGTSHGKTGLQYYIIWVGTIDSAGVVNQYNQYSNVITGRWL